MSSELDNLIQTVADAAKAGEKATARPWCWTLRPKSKQMSLESAAWVVMAFARWGMGGATALFRDAGQLKRAADFGKPIAGREHHEWAKELDHPDANYITAAANLDLPAIAAALRRAKAAEELARTIGELAQADDYGRRVLNSGYWGSVHAALAAYRAATKDAQ